MIGLRYVRTSVLSSSAFLWEAIDTTARGHAMTAHQVVDQRVKAGLDSGRGACGLSTRAAPLVVPRTTADTPSQTYRNLPAIARDHSTSPGKADDSSKPQHAADQHRVNHSYSSSTESVEMDEDRMKTDLLDKALSYVATHGWTIKAIQSAAEDMNLSPVFAGVCDGKEKDLVEHFIRTCNQQLFARLREAGPEFTSLSTADKIKLAVRWRLEMIAPYSNTWPQAMAAMATADKVATALELMAELIDGIWEAADGAGAGSSKQSKRVILQIIYTTTELYMLTDFSPGHADTWQALDRRVEDALALGEGAQHLERSVMEVFNRLQTFGRP